MPPQLPRSNDPLPSNKIWRAAFQNSFIGPLALLKAALSPNGSRSEQRPALQWGARFGPWKLAAASLRFVSRSYPDRVVLDLDVQLLAIHARQFDDRHQIVALLKEIDGRIGARAGSRVAKPIAGK